MIREVNVIPFTIGALIDSVPNSQECRRRQQRAAAKTTSTPADAQRLLILPQCNTSVSNPREHLLTYYGILNSKKIHLIEQIYLGFLN